MLLRRYNMYIKLSDILFFQNLFFSKLFQKLNNIKQYDNSAWHNAKSPEIFDRLKMSVGVDIK